MWTRVRPLALRALVDVVVLLALGAVVVVVLWAWQGHQAFVVIQNTIAQQRAQSK